MTASRTSCGTRRRTPFPADLFHPDFPTLCAHLGRRKVDYLVIGGWAAIAHGVLRATLDVDLFVRPREDNVSRLIGALSEVGFGIARELAPKEILGRPVFIFADQIRVDIFTKPWGLDDFDTAYARRLEAEFDSVRIPFVCLDDLVLTKKTGREKDEADVKALLALAERRWRDSPPAP